MRALAACAALAALACAKPIEELYPIHCVDNGLCPAPWVCVNQECLTSVGCEPGEASSCPAERPRCTLVRTDLARFGAQCVPASAGRVEGSSCTMVYSFYEISGLPFPQVELDCAAGTFCYAPSLGIPEQAQVAGTCRRFCTSDAACGAGSRCFDAFGTRVALPGATGPQQAGLCLPSCKLLTAGCAAGSECTVALDVDHALPGYGMCVTPGTVFAEGDVGCSVRAPCSAGQACIPEPCTSGGACVGGFQPVCRRLCKPGGTSTCGAGKSCRTDRFALTDGAGLCY